MKVREMKRVTFRASDETVAKLEAIAQRYGMSVNALCGYIVGRWIDENYNLQDKLLDKVAQHGVSDEALERIFSNPVYRSWFTEMVETVLRREAEAEARKAQSEA